MKLPKDTLQEAVVMDSSNDLESSKFWSETEKRFFEDLRKIECSRMNFAEKKYYTKLVSVLYRYTLFYEKYETFSDYFWRKGV